MTLCKPLTFWMSVSSCGIVSSWGAGVRDLYSKAPGPPEGLASAPCYTRLTLALFRLDEFWFSDGSLSDKSKCADPGLMPLPDTGTGLDWSHLVDAARAFEGKDSRPLGGGSSSKTVSTLGWPHPRCDKATPQGHPAASCDGQRIQT